MQVRDGPETTPQMPVILPSFTAPTVTPVSRLIPTPKRASATSGSKPRKPSQKAAKKPPQSSGYEWRKNGAGWDLRKVVWIESATSGKQRKRPYLGHLSKSAFGELKRKHKGAALDAAIQQWIEAHDR